MKMPIACLCLALLAGATPFDLLISRGRAAETATTETIVLVRHGEKPPSGLGQLNCRGLNRALALPWVIKKAFGTPAAIFAPNPAEQKSDDGELYDYVRALATIEPTAIAFGLPIHSAIGQARIDDLQRQLNSPIYHDAYVLVAWEHTGAMLLARALLKQFGGDPGLVPDWKGSDFDSIYVVRIHRAGTAATASFELKHEGLDGQPTVCPRGAQ
jgi:hypothetical protein